MKSKNKNADSLLFALQKIETFPDGRQSLAKLYETNSRLETMYGFKKEIVYTITIQNDRSQVSLPIYCFIAPHPEGQASLCLMTGIHGEEPAGPNALSNQIDLLGNVGQKLPLIIFPMMNPSGYYRNWRFHDMKFSLERRNVTDSRHLLSASPHSNKPMLNHPFSKISDAVTHYFLRLSERYPIRLLVDLHEDAKLREGYIYSQGWLAEKDPAAHECKRILVAHGIKLKINGTTRFPGEIIKNGIVFDENGGPVRDGSIDQLAGAAHIFKNSRPVSRQPASTVLVPETPTIGGITLTERVNAHEQIIRNLVRLWKLSLRKT